MSLNPTEETQLLEQAGGNLITLPLGAGGLPPFAQSYDRRLSSIQTALTSGTLTMTSVWLLAGKVVSGISFLSGATAEAGGSNLWYALYRSDLTLVGQTANDVGAASFAALTLFRKALTSPQVAPYTGLYYVGICCVATTPPGIVSLSTHPGAMGSITGMGPVLGGTSTTGLTGSVPSPAGALTAGAFALYALID